MTDSTTRPAEPAATCLNCASALHGPFCSQCGQRAITGRLQAKDLAHEVAAKAFDLDAAYPRTIVDLTTRPGAAVRDWVEGKRQRYVGPAQYFASALAIMLLIFAIRHVRPSELGAVRVGGTGVPEMEDAVEALMGLLDRHMQFLILASMPFFSLAAGIAYHRRDVTLPDRLVLFTYVIAHAALLGNLPRLVVGVGNPALNASLAVASLGYYAWATRGFFGGGWGRAILTVLGGYLAFLVAIMILMIVVMGTVVVLSMR